MVSGGLGVFSIFSVGSFTFFSIVLYVGELALYILIGYRLFYLIGEFGTGLAKAGSSSKDPEKGEKSL